MNMSFEQIASLQTLKILEKIEKSMCILVLDLVLYKNDEEATPNSRRWEQILEYSKAYETLAKQSGKLWEKLIAIIEKNEGEKAFH